MANPLPPAAEQPVTAAIQNTRHDLLLDAATRQLNSKGVLLTSLAEIAAALGISRSAMYYYVTDREDLVFQCYRRAAEVTARHLHEASRSGGNAAAVLQTFVTRMLDPNEPEIAARAEMAMMSVTQRDTIQGLHDAIATRLAHLLEAGHREGVLRECDVEVNSRIILSLLTWAPLAAPWARAIGPVGTSRLLAAAIATVFEGLATESTAPAFTPIDLAALLPQTVSAFDRAATLEAKREALVTEASWLFNRKGIDATSLEEIAAQVGATKRTLHHHIGSKADLVAACYERAFRIFFYIKDKMLAYPGTRLQALIAAMKALALAYPNRQLTPLSPVVGFGALLPDAQLRIDAHSKALGDAYHALIRSGITEGSIRDVDVDARALMLPGLLSWLVKDDVPTDAIAQQHIARELANFVAVGVGTRP
jgi:AcrR family transcriptional regulator